MAKLRLLFYVYSANTPFFREAVQRNSKLVLSADKSRKTAKKFKTGFLRFINDDKNPGST